MKRTCGSDVLVALLMTTLGCDGPVESELSGTTAPTYEITGVRVQPLDRRVEGILTHYVFSDTLRGQLVFSVQTQARVLPASRGAAPAGVTDDKYPGTVRNPTEEGHSRLAVDRTFVYRGEVIPADTNLLRHPSIRSSGANRDLLFAQLSPFVVGEIHLDGEAFSFAPGSYAFTLQWGSESESFSFGDTVTVFIDLTGEYRTPGG